MAAVFFITVEGLVGERLVDGLDVQPIRHVDYLMELLTGAFTPMIWNDSKR